MMIQKLGRDRFDPRTDETLIKDLLTLLQAVETDHALFFRGLAQVKFPDCFVDDFATKPRHPVPDPVKDALYQPETPSEAYETQLWEWLFQYHGRIQQEKLSNAARKTNMNRQNPWFVFRNYLAQMAIDKAQTGDYSMIHDLLAVMRNPYDPQPDKEMFAAQRPEWVRHRPGCSMLSCSS